MGQQDGAVPSFIRHVLVLTNCIPRLVNTVPYLCTPPFVSSSRSPSGSSQTSSGTVSLYVVSSFYPPFASDLQHRFDPGGHHRYASRTHVPHYRRSLQQVSRAQIIANEGGLPAALCRVFPHWLLTGVIGWISGIGMSGSAMLPFITGIISSKYGIKSLQPL